MKKHKDDIGELYNASVDAYDILYWDEQLEKYSEVFKHISNESSNILDIGIGTGIYFDKFLTEEYYIIGIDLSIRSLERAFKRGYNHYIDLILCDGENPPLRLDAIDYLISITVMHHFKNPDLFLYRVLSSIGKGIIVSFLNKVFAREDIEKMINHSYCHIRSILNDYFLICVIGSDDQSSKG